MKIYSHAIETFELSSEGQYLIIPHSAVVTNGWIDFFIFPLFHPEIQQNVQTPEKWQVSGEVSLHL